MKRENGMKAEVHYIVLFRSSPGAPTGTEGSYKAPGAAADVVDKLKDSGLTDVWIAPTVHWSDTGQTKTKAMRV